MYFSGSLIIRWASSGSFGPRPDALDHLRAEGQVRDEVAVHDVDVDAVGALLLRPTDAVGHVRVVGVEDADGDRGRGRRPSLTPPPRPATGSCAALAAEGVGALVDRAGRGAGRRPPAAARPARSAASWPHAAPISWPRLRRIVVWIAGLASVAANALDDVVGAGGPRRVGDGVHRDEVDVGVVAAEEVGHRLGVDRRVVHAADHRRLVAHAPAGRAGVVAGRLDDLGDGPAPVERHEHVAERVARGVEARPPG